MEIYNGNKGSSKCLSHQLYIFQVILILKTYTTIGIEPIKFVITASGPVWHLTSA